jgi:hypothetical protein
MIQFQQYQNPTLDEELKVLNSLDKSFTIKPEKKSDGNIDLKIIIEKSVFSNKYIQINEDLKFLLYIKKNFPIGNPHLYCLSQIFFQDIRDILPDLLNKRWGKNQKYYHIKTIIEKIPSFINNYIESNYSQDNNNKNKNQIKGKFHLDQIYQNRHLMLFPHLFFDNVYEKVFFENSELYSDEGRKLYICEGYFLLFIETSIFDNENLKLIFFAAIKSLVHIKHYTESDIVEFTWKIKGGKNNLMRIRTKDAGNIVKIITEILKKKKIKHQITNKDFRPKEGEIPAIDIDLVEEEINKYEVMLRLKENVNNENVNYLMKLYEKAVQYYSAVNDNKYENYMSKIHDMLGNEEFTKLLNEKKDNDIKDKEDKLDNKLKGEEKNANSDMNNKKEIKDDNINKNNKEEKGIKRDKFAIEGNLKKSDLDFESDEDDE